VIPRHELAGPEDAPVLLLASSLGTTLAMWDPLMPALAERFRVVRYDHRGHGGSPAPPGPYGLEDLGGDALALLDALGVARAHVCGVSLGGMVGLWLAAHAPERVGRLVACCTSARLGPPEVWRERAAAVLDGGMEAVADAVMQRWFTPRADPALVARAREMLLGVPPAGYAGCCGAIERMDLEPVLGSVTAPTLVVAATEDAATPPDHAVRIAAGVPGARVAVVPEAAHLACLERPGAVADLVLEHLAEDGLSVRRAVLGDEHVDRTIAATTPFTAPFQDLVTRFAWGAVWTRPGLDRRTRRALTLALLTALGHEHELAMHVRAALRNGLSPEEVAEVLLHTAVYAGVPAANRAFAVAQRVLDELPGSEREDAGDPG